jgi:glycosyltransferase involved in cell wall biosynthesis
MTATSPRITLALVNGMRSLGGAELWHLDAARGLQARGHRVVVVGQPGSPLLLRAAADGLETAGVPIRCDGAPWTIAQLAALLRARGITAVLCNRLKDLKAAGVAAHLAGVRVVLKSRESDHPLRRRPHYRWYYGRVATGVLVNSRATLRTTLDSAPWLPPARVHLLYKGIDGDRFHADPEPPGRPVVGFAGTLDERKGVPLLMAAWPRVLAAARGAPPLLRIAGEGPLRGALEAWRAGLPDPGGVELAGWVEDMPAFHRGLALLAVPSRYEGFGLAAAEAGACGRPVVATRASSLPEVVSDGETGLLVPPDDPAALAGAILRLLEDPDLRRGLGAAAAGFVRARFDREESLTRLADLLRPPPRRREAR